MVLRVFFLCLLLCLAHPLNALNCCVNKAPRYYINEYVDLQGETLILEDNVELCFGSSGKLFNGFVEGHNASIAGAKKNCFAVVLKGTWNTKTIKDEWFDSAVLTDNQIIKNINTLQSDRIKQDIWLTNHHELILDENNDTGLTLASNSTVHFNSTLKIKGNDLKRYSIVSINRKENVNIIGGEVIGDVGKHRYVEGSTSEWGFGVYIYKSKNVEITGMKVSKCTGDAFYISGPNETDINLYGNASKQVVLRNCVMDANRREGISLVHAEDVLIEDCKAMNMGQIEYTAPSFGLNIEPNKNNSVRNVIVRRFVTESTKADCAASSGGYQSNATVSNRSNILFVDCKFDKAMAIMSGGVVVENSEMPGLVIYPREMPDNPVTLKRCKIGGWGLLVSAQRATPFDKGRVPSYSFIKCEIAPTTVNKSYPALIWGTDVAKLSAVNISFDGCKIDLLKGRRNNDLVVSGFNVRGEFKRCTIDASDYPLLTRGCTFDSCQIYCKYVKVTSLPNQSNVLRRCTIVTKDANTVLIVDRSSKGRTCDRLVIEGCIFKNRKAKQFVLPEGNWASGIVVKGNRFRKSE